MIITNLEGLKPRFSGHETFPLRHAWIPKALPLVKDNSSILFNPEHLMLSMGVGKNMARAVRHWLESARLVELRDKANHTVTEIADIIFHPEADPYIENAETIWLIHYLISTNIERNSLWIYLFNIYAKRNFSKSSLSESIYRWCEELSINKPSETTLNRDLTTLLGTYSTATLKREKDLQAVLSCPLKELNIFTHRVEYNEHIWKFRQLTFGEISEDLFAFCLMDFLEKNDLPQSVLFSDLISAPLSPARVFNFSENLLTKYLQKFGLRSDHPYTYNITDRKSVV